MNKLLLLIALVVSTSECGTVRSAKLDAPTANIVNVFLTFLFKS
jgi:hypothetical protein